MCSTSISTWGGGREGGRDRGWDGRRLEGRREGGREGGREGTDLLGIAKAAESLHDDPCLVASLVPSQQPPGGFEEEGGAEELEAGEEGSNGEQGPPSTLRGKGVGQEVWGEGGKGGRGEGGICERDGRGRK